LKLPLISPNFTLLPFFPFFLIWNPFCFGDETALGNFKEKPHYSLSPQSTFLETLRSQRALSGTHRIAPIKEMIRFARIFLVPILALGLPASAMGADVGMVNFPFPRSHEYRLPYDMLSFQYTRGGAPNLPAPADIIPPSEDEREQPIIEEEYPWFFLDRIRELESRIMEPGVFEAHVAYRNVMSNVIQMNNSLTQNWTTVFLSQLAYGGIPHMSLEIIVAKVLRLLEPHRYPFNFPPHPTERIPGELPINEILDDVLGLVAGTEFEGSYPDDPAFMILEKLRAYIRLLQKTDSQIIAERAKAWIQQSNPHLDEVFTNPAIQSRLANVLATEIAMKTAYFKNTPSEPEEEIQPEEEEVVENFEDLDLPHDYEFNPAPDLEIFPKTSLIDRGFQWALLDIAMEENPDLKIPGVLEGHIDLGSNIGYYIWRYKKAKNSWFNTQGNLSDWETISFAQLAFSDEPYVHLEILIAKILHHLDQYYLLDKFPPHPTPEYGLGSIDVRQILLNVLAPLAGFSSEDLPDIPENPTFQDVRETLGMIILQLREIDPEMITQMAQDNIRSKAPSIYNLFSLNEMKSALDQMLEYNIEKNMIRYNPNPSPSSKIFKTPLTQMAA